MQFDVDTWLGYSRLQVVGYRQPASFQLMRAKSRWHFVLYLPISELFKYSEFQMIYSTLFFLLHTHTQYHQSIHTTNMKVLIMNIKEKLHCKNKNDILDPFTESTHTHSQHRRGITQSTHTQSTQERRRSYDYLWFVSFCLPGHG